MPYSAATCIAICPSAAAKQLGCGKSVVSRQLVKLEEELGAHLIQRSTRRLALTEIGNLCKFFGGKIWRRR